MNGAEKDSERKSTVTATAVVSRELHSLFFLLFLRPLRASANPVTCRLTHIAFGIAHGRYIAHVGFSRGFAPN